MTLINNITEKEIWTNGTEEVHRLQYYAWAEYDADGDFRQANPSGDDFPYAVSTLKRMGYKYVDTQYFYVDELGTEHEFATLDRCPIHQ
jgi:hypothetical protein